MGITHTPKAGAKLTGTEYESSTAHVVTGTVGADYDVSPNPTVNDEEFKVTGASTPSGWTSFQTPTTIDTNTTARSCLYLKKTATAATTGHVGIYRAWSPANGDCVTTRIVDAVQANVNYQRGGGILIGVANPVTGVSINFWMVSNGSGSQISVTRYTSAGNFSSTLASFGAVNDVQTPLYLRVRYNSSTSIDFLVSRTGLIWTPVFMGYNPGVTIASIGVTTETQQATYDSEMLVDWIRYGTSVVQSESLLWQNVGGPVGSDNWLYDIPAVLGSHGNTNWSTLNVDNAELYGGDIESSGAQNDEIYWDVGLGGGTWDLTLLHYKGANRGIYTVSVDDVSVGTIDGYNAGSPKNNYSTLTGITIASGKRRIKLKMATKNASSSSYFGTIQAIQLRRTSSTDLTTAASDPIAQMFGSPTTSFEFSSSSLTGLTAMGTVQTEDANTTVPGTYYLRNNSNASPYWRGRSLSLSPPFTAIISLSTNPSRNYEGAGILYGESTVMSSGKFDVISEGVGTADYQVGAFSWTGPGTFSTTIATKSIANYRPLFIGIKAVSSSDVSAYYSFDGKLWFPVYESRNPGFTIAMLAIASAAQNTTGFSAAYDFLRIWNTAKTFVV